MPPGFTITWSTWRISSACLPAAASIVPFLLCLRAAAVILRAPVSPLGYRFAYHRLQSPRFWLSAAD